MIVVDYSHLQHRNLYIAIMQAKPKKKDGKCITDDFINFWYHLMLNSLRLLGHKFTNGGEIILAIDDRSYWRKDIYPEYKGHRGAERAKSDINFDEFFAKANEFLEELNQYFPYTVLHVDKCEADDIIGVLSKMYGRAERVVAVSSDKDMRQVIENGAELYDPIKREMVRMNDEEVRMYKLQHTLQGDSGDNINHVYYGTKFSDVFIKYLKANQIYLDTPEEFEKLSIADKLYSDFDIYKTNKKGEVLLEKDIFKVVGFGEVGAAKAALNLPEFFQKHPLLERNYKRNAELVLFENIPQDIQNNIIVSYQNLTPQYDPNKIMQFLMKYNLKKLLMDITDFYITPQKKETPLDEWM